MEGLRSQIAFALALTLFATLCSCEGPEQGIFELKLDEDNRYGAVSKSLQVESEIGISVSCALNGGQYRIEWMVRYTECSELNPNQLNNSATFLEDLFTKDIEDLLMSEDYIAYQKYSDSVLTCQDDQLLDDRSGDLWSCSTTELGREQHCNFFGIVPSVPQKGPANAPAQGPTKATPKATTKAPSKVSAKTKEDTKSNVKKRSADTKVNTKPQKGNKTANTSKPLLRDRVTTTNERAGRYWVVVHFIPLNKDNAKMEVTVTISMKSKTGFLSASQVPLLVFYGIMCGVYSLVMFIWLLMMAFQWKDLLRIQFWIGGVMLLGLVEKAVFYAEFENINNYGKSMAGAITFAEIVSCSKRSLARMMVVIVSLGYGITRPRLGRDLHWVIGAGMAFFIMSSIEACLRIKGTQQQAVIAILPLAVLDAIICWWIFKSLVDTTRTLRLRRNVVKLWLYRHFTNTLIFCVLAAVIFLLWSFKTHKWNTCIKKWHELWLDDAYWHVLFCVILVVIVILFRPTANNQRYAFSPLTDRDEDDESQEPMINDAFEGVKMRNVLTNRNESQSGHKVDDDLKWVEDNIPASVADAALGAFDDSEDELVTNLERNKME